MRAPESEYDPILWQENAVTLSPRRWWVRWGLAFGLVILVVWLAGITLHPASGTIPPTAGGAIGPLITASAFSPFARARWMSRRALTRYDEFERAAIADATLRSYNLLLLLVLAAGAAFVLIGEAAPPPRSTLVGWLFALIAVGAFLPTLIAEWTVPLPDREDRRP